MGMINLQNKFKPKIHRKMTEIKHEKDNRNKQYQRVCMRTEPQNNV